MAARSAVHRVGKPPAIDAQGKTKAFVGRINAAAPLELMVVERDGIPVEVLDDMAKCMAMSMARLMEVLDIPKATVVKKRAQAELINGRSGHAVLGMVRLLGIAYDIVGNNASPNALDPNAADFDAAEWLGRWIERPQPALAGRKPADFLDTPTGVDVVARLLGSLESGSYQ